ncbi:MAG TPA: hypothetical protein VK110_08765 [Salinisphaeraceae bacterium]|nr:hypothetical protein [Salinisphaeraceae bacterium]
MCMVCAQLAPFDRWTHDPRDQAMNRQAGGAAALARQQAATRRLAILNELVAPQRLQIRDDGQGGFNIRDAKGGHAHAGTLDALWYVLAARFDCRIDVLGFSGPADDLG